MSKIAAFNPIPSIQNRALLASQPAFCTITTSAVAGEPTRIAHGLGRIPNGYAIIKQPPGLLFMHGYDEYNMNADTRWTTDVIYVIFSVGSVSLTVAVF